MKNTKKYFKLTFTSILIALMFALSWTVLGMIPLGLASCTTVFIPVCIGIVCLDDFKCTTVLGLSFGICSLLRSLMPNGILDPYFVNPLVSVLPRLVASLLAHCMYKIALNIFKNKKISAGFAGGFMALFNTIFTIGMLLFCYYGDILDIVVSGDSTISAFLGSIILLNMLPEIALGIILSVTVYLAYYKVFEKKYE